MSMHQEILSGLKWTAGTKLAGQIINWAITIFVMRLLVPEDYGLLAMASVFVAFMLMLAEIGLGPALVQKQDVDEMKLRQAFGIVIMVNLCLLAALNFLAPVIVDFFGDKRLLPILRVLSLQFPISALSIIPNVLLQRKLEFRKQSLIDFSTAVFSSVLTLILALAHCGVWSLVLGNLVAGVFRTVAVNYLAPFPLLPIFSGKGMRELIAFGGNISTARLLWFFYNQADVLIIGKLLGKEMLGLYSVAMQLASLPTQRVSAILNQVAFPVLSRFQNDSKNLSDYLLKVIRALSFFSFPVLWGISSTSNEIVFIFLGPDWQPAILPLQLLSLIMPLRMLANFLPTAADAIGRPDVALKNMLFASLFMPIAFFVASHWGIVGIAFAWVTAYPVVVIINTYRMLHIMHLTLRDFFEAIAPAVISAAGMYATVWAVKFFMGSDANYLIRFLAMITSGVIMYTCLAILFNNKGCREVFSLIR